MLNDNITAVAELVVADSDTARRIALEPGDSFPDVFATARMIALMEVAAARVMRPTLQDGQLSVGVSLNVRHTAATPVGSRVHAVAILLRTEGKLSHFKVQAYDDAGAIGEGEHVRAVIDAARLLSGAERRRKPLSP